MAPDVAPAIALAPFGKVVAADASQATSLPLELKGVIAAIPAELSTAFIAADGKPAVPFHATSGGQQALGKARLRWRRGFRIGFADVHRVAD